ncbi:RNA polymerase sigma factor [Microvirga sp. TS319]|uniref:RNA polymerase sigma factor n=1 Tax=Microvirga sp. TS319 TaxID=3241165 RepID=UPI00351A5770
MRIRMEAVADPGALDDSGLVRHALAGEGQAFRAIMQRHNRRLYRVARGILGNDTEAEDAVQEAYLQAFSHLRDFRGDARLSTWLTRIVINEALGRVRRRRDLVDLSLLDRMEDGQARVLMFSGPSNSTDPEDDAGRAQLRRMLERAVDGLPPDFRSVFMMREIEEMSIEETASQLGINPATVKTRLHRARLLLRRALAAQLVSTLKDAFPFDGQRCARIAERVMRRLEQAQG